MSAIGTRFDLVGKYSIVRGLPWSFDFTWRQDKGKAPVDLTGASMRFVVGDTPAAGSVEYSSAGDIFLGGATGKVSVYLSGTATAGLEFSRPSYWLFLTDSLGRERLFLYGRLAIKDIE